MPNIQCHIKKFVTRSRKLIVPKKYDYFYKGQRFIDFTLKMVKQGRKIAGGLAVWVLNF